MSMKVINVMMVDTDTGDIIKSNQVDIVSYKQLFNFAKSWFDCFIRGVTYPVGKGHWQLTLTVAEFTPKREQNKQLSIF